MDIEDVRSFKRGEGGGGAYILTGARKAEFYAHFADKESPPRDTCRVLSAKFIRQKCAKLDFPPHCASTFLLDARPKKGSR